MKAITFDRYGPPAEVLHLADVDRPVAGEGEVVVRARAASLNAADWHAVRGEPRFARLMLGLRQPKNRFPGCDVAGEVVEVGPGVDGLRPGDQVFGTPFERGYAAFAEYVRVPADQLAPMPANVSFDQAAAVPLAGLTALQAIRDQGQVEAGHRVLIIGASGGVGTFAVQIAKSLDTEVTGVCSTRNTELVGSLGADEVIDYTTDSFTDTGRRYDLVFQVSGYLPVSACRRLLAPGGTFVSVSGDSGALGRGPLARMAATKVQSLFTSEKIVAFVVKPNDDDLRHLGALIESGSVTPAIDRTYPLVEVPEAICYLEDDHAQGKIVITI